MSSIVIKIVNTAGSVRRRHVNTSSLTLEQVHQLGNMQNGAKLTWRDEENDLIEIETEADLQEAIQCAVSQQSALRLFVANVQQPAPGTPPFNLPSPVHVPVHAHAPPTAVQNPQVPPVDIRRNIQTFIGYVRQNFISASQSAIGRVWSEFDQSAILQGIREDSRSIRSVFESRVEQNRSAISIASFAIRAALVVALCWPSFWWLCMIAVGLFIFPRNILTRRSERHCCILLGLISIRVVIKLLYALSCLVFPTLFFLAVLGAIAFIVHQQRRATAWTRSRAHMRTHQRDAQRNSHRQSHSGGHQEQEPTDHGLTDAQQTDLNTLSSILPNVSKHVLRQTYLRYKDVNRTITELVD